MNQRKDCHAGNTREALPPAIRLHSVSKRYGTFPALSGVELVVRQGEVVAYLGPNGAGKTTTIDIICGLVRPSEGSVEVLGMAPREAVRRGLVSAVQQSGGLLKDLSVQETVEYVSRLFARHRPTGEVLERAGIAGIAKRMVRSCSGGEQQRLRFALALLPDPLVLILDEPTQGMDVEGRRAFWNAIRQDAQDGRTILFATHYLEEADAYADRVVLLRQGAVVADGTAAEIKNLAAGRLVRATIPGGADRLPRDIPGADQVEVRGETVLVHTADSDEVARWLLTKTAARDLEVTAKGLEEAFIELTRDV
ncbi:MAG: ABC transporter ATP-binding protein, partial [Candidatus Dormibacteria bacterium]